MLPLLLAVTVGGATTPPLYRVDGPVIGIRITKSGVTSGASLAGYPLSEIRFYGQAEAIIAFIDNSGVLKQGLLTFKECNCLLEAGPLVGRCVVRTSEKLGVPSPLQHMPPGLVLIVIPNVNEFTGLYANVWRQRLMLEPQALTAAAGAAGRKPPAQPPAPPTLTFGATFPPSAVNRPCDATTGCKPIASLTVSTEGKASFSLGCKGGIHIEVTSDGKVAVSVTAGAFALKSFAGS